MLDSAPPPAANVEAAPSPLAAQFVEIQTQTTQGKGSGAVKPDQGDAFFQALIAVNPAETAQGFRDAQATAKAFVEDGPDKSQALAKESAAFEAAIKQSDADYMTAIVKFSPAYDQKKHDLGGEQQQVVEALVGIKAFVADQVPEEDRTRVAEMINLASSKGTSPELKTAVLKAMDQYPGLRQVFETAQTAVDNEQKGEAELRTAAKPLLHAASEEAATRYIYAHAMEVGGETGRAVLEKQEAQSKMDDAYFEFLEIPKPPKPLLKA